MTIVLLQLWSNITALRNAVMNPMKSIQFQANLPSTSICGVLEQILN